MQKNNHLYVTAENCLLTIYPEENFYPVYISKLIKGKHKLSKFVVQFRINQ